jgi:hypothetical protein
VARGFCRGREGGREAGEQRLYKLRQSKRISEGWDRMNIFASLSKIALLLGTPAIRLPELTADPQTAGERTTRGKQVNTPKASHADEAGGFHLAPAAHEKNTEVSPGFGKNNRQTMPARSVHGRKRIKPGGNTRKGRI